MEAIVKLRTVAGSHVITLPKDLQVSLGWAAGDRLRIEIVRMGTARVVRVVNIENTPEGEW